MFYIIGTLVVITLYILFKGEQMKEYDLGIEEYREYDFEGRVYRIDKPVKLFWEKGHTTHRVLDSAGVVHVLPVPSSFGCVLRFKSVDPTKPVAF